NLMLDDDPDLFRRWQISDLLREADRPFEWTVRKLLPAHSFGPIGGEKKSLKTYFAMFLAVGVASGAPIFDHFTVPAATPVLAYVGEGGRRPFAARLKRVAQSMGVSLTGLPLITSFNVAPIRSTQFKDSLSRDLEEIQPG